MNYVQSLTWFFSSHLQVVLKGDPKKLSLHGVRINLWTDFHHLHPSKQSRWRNARWCHWSSHLSLALSPPRSVCHTADMRRVFGGLQSERRAGSVAMPTCLPQEVSTIIRVFLFFFFLPAAVLSELTFVHDEWRAFWLQPPQELLSASTGI